MRIVGGAWAGRQLTSPGGRVRPTAEAVRDALLGMLAAALPGARVLDLFAGSGALGIEALSRGARTADFVEHDPAALHALKANVAALRLKSRTRIFKRDAIPFAEVLGPGAYDIVFADPPYGSAKLDRVLQHWLAAPYSGILALEHAADHVLPVRGSEQRRVADTIVTLFRRNGDTP
jgi:16S rRNA (guanine966-N2)-methyltransferase